MPQDSTLSYLDAFPDDLRGLLESSGNAVLDRLGESLDTLVADILLGENVRNATEMLTRRRLALLGAGIVAQLVGVSASNNRAVESAHTDAASLLPTLRGARLKQDRWLRQWLLGLTDKAFQNVLRDAHTSLSSYASDYRQALEDASAEFEKQLGSIRIRLTVGDSAVELESADAMLFLTAIGAMTLTIRGSEKSTYGKLFEKLVLAAALSILGFQFVPTLERNGDALFTLSQTEKREADATLLYRPTMKTARFDIGFIGRGNPRYRSTRLRAILARWRSAVRHSTLLQLFSSIVSAQTVRSSNEPLK